MIIVIADEKEGDRIAGHVAAMDPYGISVVEADGQAVVVLVGGGGAEAPYECPGIRQCCAPVPVQVEGEKGPPCRAHRRRGDGDRRRRRLWAL